MKFNSVKADEGKTTSAEENSQLSETGGVEQLQKLYGEMLNELENRLEKLKVAQNAQKQIAAEAKEPLGESVSNGKATDFESFVRQFPEADADAAVRGAIEGGDFSEGAFTRAYVRQLKAQIDGLIAEQNSEQATLKRAMDSESVKGEIIKQYLSGVGKNNRLVPRSPAGTTPATPKHKPRSISEAGKLAKDIFKNKQ